MSTNGEMNSQKMTGSAQTMLTWVKELQFKEEIPQHYLQSIQGIPFKDPFPYILLVPPLKNQRNKPAERLVILLDDVLYIYEKRGRKIIPDQIKLHPGIDIEMGNALLYSWITFRETKHGIQTHTITIPFNTATARYFDPIIQHIKPISISPDENPNVSQSPHNNLVPANFKYNAFVRECITNDTRIINSLWQPMLQKKILHIFGKTFYQNITLPHYFILTNRELIILWDDENSIENRGVRYGGIRRFIPYPLIFNMSAIKMEKPYCKFIIKLVSGEIIEQILIADLLEDIKQFISDFEASAKIY